ncbi:MAG: Cysteine synthase [Firmicutes bacterium]|nr:Cysteine synthase [candidate division NPL-UPA2 bacterium]
MTIARSILEAVGNTPLVELNRITAGLDRRILVKVESQNPGGSIKTRTALSMIEDAERRGLLKADSIIVEFTSGNQGIGLALVAAVKGYKCTIVMPACMSEERRRIMASFGAEIILTPVGKDITETFSFAEAKVHEMIKRDPRCVLAGQFVNPANPRIHATQTAAEIIAQLEGVVPQAFVAAIGTGGTITGAGQRLKAAYPAIRVVAVEPTQAAILSGGVVANHKQQGIGDGFIPEILDTSVYDEVVVVSCEAAYAMTRRLAREEGLFAGISSGTNVCAALAVAQKLPADSVVVTILPDLGERYLSTADLF